MHVESTLVKRARRLELSPATFRKLALGSAAWLWLIIVSGATVRLTASGLGCEHWPGCTAGNPFPSKSYHSFIEFGNRVVSALTILATLVGWVGARFTPGVPRWLRRLALAHVPGDARAGAARRDHGLRGAEPVARHVALHARARRARRRRGARRRGDLLRARALRDRLPQTHPARRLRRGRGAARARRHGNGLDRRRAAPGQRRRRAALAPARGALRARPRDRDLRRRSSSRSSSTSFATASSGRCTRKAAASCSSCCSCRWASGSCSTGRIFPGGSCSFTLRLPQPSGLARSRS